MGEAEKQSDLAERKDLLNTIKNLQKRIQVSRDEIFRLYTLKRQTEEFANDLDIEEFSTSIQNDPNLELYFYSKFIEIKVNKDQSLITVLFPYKKECRYGINLIKNTGRWCLEKCFLPYSVDIKDFKTQINRLTIEQIPEYIDKIQNNVYAFCIREEQVTSLKKIIPCKIQLYHCLRFSELELTCKIYDNNKYQNTLILCINYGDLSVRPVEVFCKIEGNENEEKEQYFNNCFKVFYKTDLVSAFNEVFKGALKDTFRV